jgi:hypothetical protein
MEGTMKTNRLKIVTIGTYLGIALLLSVLVTGSGFAQDQPQFIRMVQEMRGEKSGLSSPVGVVFSSRANTFHVIETRGNNDTLAGVTTIKNISVFGHGAGSTQIKIGIEDPLNVAMDNIYGRLLIYQATTQQLIEVDEDSTGVLDANTLTIYDVSYFGLQDPQGMTFDPIQGYLYFLDGVEPRLVRIMLPPDGSFTSAMVDAVNLPWAGNIGLRGIAFDPMTGDFQVVSPSEQRLYEFSNSGEVVALRDLAEFNLSNSQGIVFAPSGDQTDNPIQTSLYLADSGLPVESQTNALSNDSVGNASTSGKIVELSMIQPLAQINADFPSALVKTTNMAAFTQPSADPCGVVYISTSNTLLASDSEIEEVVGGITHFMGANLWEMTLGGTVVHTANISPVQPTYVSMTPEPTDVTWNPGNGHFYFSDDDWDSVFDLNPGVDGQYGTADDSWTSFPTVVAGVVDDGDPEGITYDSWHDRLFVIDGVNREVYQYTLTGDLVGQFDVAIFGLLDTEGIAFNPISGSLFIMSNLTNKTIIETDTNGILLSSIDFSASSATDPAGLAYAPASDGSGAKHFYIVDRGLDNNQHPNEIDGKMYEMTAPISTPPTNTPPVVNAGPDQSINIAASANLNGIATDDGLPNPPGSMTISWSVSSGPGTVTIANPNALSTTASFSATGTYALRLTASDSAFSIYDEVNINVTSVAGSSIIEDRVVSGSDDAEEDVAGTVSLYSLDLQLVYDTSNQTVGMRFKGINIPTYAHIDAAYVQFHVDAPTSYATSLTIWGEAQDNPGTFLATSQNISTRLKTSASVGWIPPSWTGSGQAGLDQRTSNIASIIQELVNRPDWSAGNSMVITIQGTGRRDAVSFDGVPAWAPKLHIEFTPPTNHPPVAVNDTYTINEDQLLSRNAGQGVLKNDSDPDGDPITAILKDNPSHGTLNLNSNGSFTYTPAQDYNGSDSFTYNAYDGMYKSHTATVNNTINPINDTPTDIALSANTIAENLPINTVVGTLSTTDPDVGDTFIYTLVSGAGSTDNASFNISGNNLRTSAVFNYETKNSYSIRVRSTDAGSLYFEKAFTILVTNVNETPTDIALSANAIAENLAINTVVGTLSTTDPDVGDTFNYTLVSGAGSTDNASFNISGSNLRTSAVFDYETKNSYSIRVRSTDAGSLYFEKAFTILVTNVNETPTDIALSANTVAENLVINTVVGTLSTTDPDVGDTFNYTLVSGAGSTDNASFNISGSSLRTSAVFDYETKNSYSIRVRSTDAGSLYFEKAFTILVTNVNDAPVAVNDNYAMVEDTALIVDAPGVLGNDTDPEHDPLSAILNVGPTHGELTLNANGSFVYTPDFNYNGTDSFTYHARDGALNSNIATVTITIVDKIEVFYLPVINR